MLAIGWKGSPARSHRPGIDETEGEDASGNGTPQTFRKGKRRAAFERLAHGPCERLALLGLRACLVEGDAGLSQHLAVALEAQAQGDLLAGIPAAGGWAPAGLDRLENLTDAVDPLDLRRNGTRPDRASQALRQRRRLTGLLPLIRIERGGQNLCGEWRGHRGEQERGHCQPRSG